MKVVKVYRVMGAELKVGELHNDYFPNIERFEESYGIIVDFLLEANLDLETFIENLLDNPYLLAFTSKIKKLKEDEEKRLLTFTTEDGEELEVDIMARAYIESSFKEEKRELIFSGDYLYLINEDRVSGVSVYLD